MAQIVFRYLLIKYSIIIDFIFVYFGMLVHQFLDINSTIDYDKKKYGAVFVLTCLVLVSRIILNVSIFFDKRKEKALENERIELENEKLRIENERQKKDLL